MSGLFLMLTLAGGVWALTHGTAERLGVELMRAGEQAVSLTLTLAGGYMVWCGLMKILERSGAAEGFARLMKRPVQILLGEEAQDAGVRQLVCMNLAANLLGLGGAAAPAGLEAMQRMAQHAKDGRPTHGMCMFLLLNTCCLQLLPATVLSMRTAMGAAQPGDILLPALVGSAAAAGTAAALGLLMRLRA